MATKKRSIQVNAHYLTELANELNSVKLVCFEGEGVDDTVVSLLKTALDFSRLPVGVRFKALVENWDLVRINRELY